MRRVNLSQSTRLTAPPTAQAARQKWTAAGALSPFNRSPRISCAMVAADAFLCATLASAPSPAARQLSSSTPDAMAVRGTVLRGADLPSAATHGTLHFHR